MSCRITILCDNSVGPITGTLGEHGFSALVEREGTSLLFDTGSGETLLHNALRMNRDLRKVAMVALSHGHYDHTGGLRPFLQLCGGRRILAHPAVFSARYRKRDTGAAVSIGIPFAEDFLRGLGADFELSADPRELVPGLFLSGEVPLRTEFETGDSGLYADSEGSQRDLLRDDQSLVIVGDKGLVLLLGCCHAGLINTIEAACEITGVRSVDAVIGGTHLGFCGTAQLDATVEAIRSYGVKRIYGSHCTGFAAAARLHGEFPGRFQQAMVGTSLEV